MALFYKSGQAPEAWMEDRDLETIKAVEALRLEYENGNPLAALRALQVLGPFFHGDEREPEFRPSPDWLDVAVKSAMHKAVTDGTDSIRGAFGARTGRGIAHLDEQLGRRYMEDMALAVVLGIQEGRRRANIRYPCGDSCYSLAALHLDCGAKPDQIEKWCAKARARKAEETMGSFPRLIRRKIAERIRTTRTLP